jgi:hypothetical protein
MVLDLMALVDPLMTSPLLYPLLAGLGSMDGVLPMVPSEAAVLAAGVFAHTGTPSLLLVVVATALGVFIGDHLAYGLSRSVLGPRLIRRSKARQPGRRRGGPAPRPPQRPADRDLPIPAGRPRDDERGLRHGPVTTVPV